MNLNIENVLISKNISFDKKDYKYLLVICIMIIYNGSKKCKRVQKVIMFKPSGRTFWLKMMAYWKNIVLFGIKSALMLKNNFMADVLTKKIIIVWKTKIKSYGDETTGF